MSESEKTPVSRLLLVVLGGVALLAVVVVLYERGWLPLAGPFAAFAIAGVLVYAVMWLRHRRLMRLRDDARALLERLGEELPAERARPVAERDSAADDGSLETARTQADGALQRLAWAHEAGAAPYVARLGELATSWRPGSALRTRVEELTAVVADLERVVRRMERVAASRRPAGDR